MRIFWPSFKFMFSEKKNQHFRPVSEFERGKRDSVLHERSSPQITKEADIYVCTQYSSLEISGKLEKITRTFVCRFHQQ